MGPYALGSTVHEHKWRDPSLGSVDLLPILLVNNVLVRLVSQQQGVEEWEEPNGSFLS